MFLTHLWAVSGLPSLLPVSGPGSHYRRIQVLLLCPPHSALIGSFPQSPTPFTLGGSTFRASSAEPRDITGTPLPSPGPEPLHRCCSLCHKSKTSIPFLTQVPSYLASLYSSETTDTPPVRATWSARKGERKGQQREGEGITFLNVSMT